MVKTQREINQSFLGIFQSTREFKMINMWFLEKEMATHSSILAWRIPWTEEPGRLQSVGLQRVRHDLVTEHAICGFVWSWMSRFLQGFWFSDFPSGSDGKESVCNAGDLGLIAKLERSSGEGNSCPLQYSYLENSRDRVWRATVHRVPKSQWLSD